VTVHVISVGVSLRDSLAEPRKPNRELAGRPELAAKIQDRKPHRLLAEQGISDGSAASAWLSRALAEAGSQERDDAAAAGLAELSAGVRPDLWPDSVSAELGTFARVRGAGRPLGRKDTAILVSSDTADGLVAGLWNSIALTGGNLGRVRYLAAPDQPQEDPRGHAVLVRVPGLDAGDEQGFRQAMRGLGLLGHNLLGVNGIGPDEAFRFYLSGGFKAAIPYLIGLAEGLRSLSPERDVAAYVLHEATNSAAIRLPLRWLMADWVREELSGFGAGGVSRVKPADPPLLDGYAYERDGKTWRLTAFGEGLRALFGLLPESVGG
jgi:hypothetical protein